jgi:hypothetical protein
MTSLTYSDAPFAVRADLAAAHARAWGRLGGPGAWLDGATRVAVAAEARHAPGCRLCVERKAAVSPFAVDGAHDALGALPPAWIDVVHRIVSDPGRLTRGWYERSVGEGRGIAEGEYVELVSVLAHVTAIDTFARGLGVPLRPLPAPQPGAPSGYRPSEARRHEAWVPHIAADEYGPNEADFLSSAPANIRLALTLAPDEARSFFDLVANQYIPGPAMRDFEREYRAITHAQIELVAGRVSALNRCTY